MATYRATPADIRELSEAYARVTEVRKDLAKAERKVTAIKTRLQAAETQLGNAIRQVTQNP